MKITVTSDDIRLGQRFLSCACPVARAVRQAAGVRWVTVGLSYITWRDASGAFYQTQTPRRVARLIKAFDAGEPVQPFSFLLREKRP